MRKFIRLQKVSGQTAIVLLLLLLKLNAFAQPVPGISVNGQPVAQGDTVYVCQGNSLNYTSTATGYTSISWEFQNGSPSAFIGAAPPAILYNTVGFDSTIQIVSNSNSNITDSFVIIVKVSNIHPVVDFSNNSNVCSGTLQQFNSTVTGTQPYTYAWSFGNGGTSTIASPVHSFTSLGCSTAVFNDTLTVTDRTGCSSTVTHPITILQAPRVELEDPDLNSPFSNCENSPTPGNPNFILTVNNISPDANCIVSYNINWGDGFSVSVPTATFPLIHTYTQIGAFNLVVTATGINGCTSTKTYIAVNQTNPAGSLGTLGTTTNLCAPAVVPFTISNWDINSIGTLYVLDFGDGTTVTLLHPLNPGFTTDTIYHTYTTSSCPNGSYTASLNVINGCGSTPFAAGNIRVLKRAESAFTVPATSFCVGQSVCFNNTTIAGSGINCSTAATTTWNFGDGSPPVSTISPCHTFSLPGIYTVTLTTTNYCGPSTFTLQICVTTPPVPGFTIDYAAGCSPLSVAVTNTTNSLNNCAAATYVWTVTYTPGICGTSSSWGFTNGTTLTSANPSFIFNNAGTYTIMLSVTNACGTFFTTKTITVTKPPAVTLAPIPNACGPVSITPVDTVNACGTGTLSYLWTFTGGTPATSSAANPGSILFSGAGIHTVSLSVTNECGTTGASQQFTIETLPAADAGNDTSFCSGGNTQLGSAPVSGVLYSWLPATGLSSTSIANPVLTLTNPTASPVFFTYILTVTNSVTNCSSKDTVVVTVNPLPVVSISPTSVSICIGNSTQLTASGADTYIWSPAAGLNTTTGSVVTANPLITTIYTVLGTVTATGCSKSTTVTVTVNPMPVVNAGTDQTLCNQPIPVQLTGTPAGGTWSGPNITAGGLFTPGSIGQIPAIYTYTNGNGCTNTDTALITVIDPTIVHAGPDTAVCLNSGNIQFTGNPAGGTWSGSPNITAGGLFTPAQAVPVNLVYSLGTGTCLTRDTLVVTVNPLPVVSISPSPVSICAGISTQLTASGADTYIWNPATGLNTITGATVTANPVVTTTYTVTGTITATGCSKSTTVTVTVNPLPVVNAGADQTLCNQPIPVQLTGSSASGTWSGPNISAGGVFTPAGIGVFSVVYTYTNANSCVNTDTAVITVIDPTNANAGPDTAFCLNSGNAQFTGSPAGGTWSGTNITVGGLFSPSLAGTFSIVYSIGSGTCLTRDTVIVTVNPLPIVSVTPSPVSICIGNSTQLTASGADTYIWNPATGLNTITGATVTANPVVTTTYTVTGTITATGCSKSTTVTVTVNPLPVVNAGADQTLCNQPIPVQLTGSSASGTWSGPNISAGGVFTPAGIGVFSVVYTYTNANSCVNTDTAVITVIDPTNANAGPDTAFCLNSGNAQFTGSPAGGTWSGTNITVGGLFTPSLAGTFSLVYSLGTGTCLTRDTVAVTVNPLPVVSISPTSVSICAGNSTQLTASGADTYLWSPAAGLNTTTGSTVTANPLITTLYTVLGTVTATGCNKSTAATVTVNPLPVVNAGADQTLCNQLIPVQLTGTPAGGTWSGGAYITPGGVFTPNGTGVLPVIYTYTNGNNCTNRDTALINVITATVANAGPDVAFCLNSGNVQFAGIPAGGTWSGTNITPTGLFSPSTPGTVNLVYTTGASTCLTRDTVTVTVNPLPVVSVTPSPVSICIGNSTQLAASGADTYIWNPATGINTITGATVTANPVVTTIYTVTGTVTATGCSKSTTVTVTVNPDSKALFTGNPTINCDTFNLGTAITPIPFADRNALYHWYADGVEIAGSPNTTGVFPGYSMTNPGDTVIIKLVTTSLFGCKSDSMQITFITKTTAVANFTKTPASGCGPLTVTFTNTSTGIDNNTQFFWNFGNATSLTTTQTTNTTATYLNNNPNFVNVVYYVTLKVYNGCDTTYHYDSITVFPKSKARFGVDTTRGCSPFTVTINNTSPGNNINYYWDFGDTTRDTTHTNGIFTHTYNTGAITTYPLTMISENLCSRDTQTIILVVSPNTIQPFITANGNQLSGCAPHTVTFNNSSVGASQLIWDFGDNTGLDTIPNNQSTINHTFNIPGTYTVIIHLKNDCSDTLVQRTIIVYAPPAANFTVSPLRICTSQFVTVSNTSEFANSYIWFWGDGTSSIFDDGIHTYNNPGPYTITLVAKRVNPSGFICTDTIRKQITVVDKIPAQITVAPGNHCVPYTLNVNAGNPSGADLIEWFIYDNNTAPGVFHFTGTNTASYIYNVAGTYSVKLIVHTTAGCVDSNTYNFDVFNTPQTTFNPKLITTCSHDTTVRFTATTSGNGTDPVTYKWFINGSLQGTSNPFNYRFQIPLTNTSQVPFTIQALAQNAAGCGDTSLAGKLIIQPLPFPAISVTPGLVQSQPFYTFGFYDAVQDSTNKTYNWTMGDQERRNGRTITYTYGDVGTYKVNLLVTDFTTGCSAKDSVRVSILYVAGSLYVPNAFYPNSKKNELKTFLPAGIGLEKYRLQIFDAWGKLLFETTALNPDGSPKEGWNGTYSTSPGVVNGNPMSQDAYVWKIVEAKFKNGKEWEGMSYNGGTPKRFGTVTLFR